MKTTESGSEITARPWDEEHVKALLHFPRFPVHLIHQDPWHAWITEHGGLKAVYAYLQNYPLSPSHHRILEVVLSSPEEISDVYANRLNISRATYFYQLREFLPALVEALNHWDAQSSAPIAEPLPPAAPILSSLPVPITKLIGADSIIQELVSDYLQGDMRLLTLLGPGGIGKTRIGIEVARQYGSQTGCPVYFVDLSPIHSVDVVISSIANALGSKGIRDLAELIPLLARKEALLVLDNFEHMIPAASLVAELLANAPLLKILITSRAALRVYGEVEYLIPPLATPDRAAGQDLNRLLEFPAVALFVQRAKAVQPAFQLDRENAEAIVELCRRLEGIPLIIELAAYQVKFFSPQAMLVRLANTKRLNFFSHGPKRVHRRQQTPRDILSWSYDLLRPNAQQLFREISVFSGAFTMAAAVAIHQAIMNGRISDAESDATAQSASSDENATALELTSLVDQSLVQQTPDSGAEPRFRMMEITREYAAEQLENNNEADEANRAHARHYLELAETIMRSVDPAIRQTWVELCEREYPNTRAAIQWAIDHGEAELGLRYIVTLWNFWKFRGLLHEGRALAQNLLEQTAQQDLPARGQVQRLIGWLAHDLRDYTAMAYSFQTNLENSEARQEKAGMALARQGLGALAQLRGQWNSAKSLIQSSLEFFQEAGDRRQIGWSLDLSGRIHLAQGELLEARQLFQTSLVNFRLLNSKSASAVVICHLGQTAFYEGSFDRATDFFRESSSLSKSMGDTHSPVVAMVSNYLAEIAAHQQHFAMAKELLELSLRVSNDSSYTWCVELANFTQGMMGIFQKDFTAAADAFREGILLQQALKENWRSLLLIEMVAYLMGAHQDWLATARLYGAAHNLRDFLGQKSFPVYLPLHETSRRQLAEHLDAETREAAWQAGASLPLEQALLYALRCLE